MNNKVYKIIHGDNYLVGIFDDYQKASKALNMYMFENRGVYSVINACWFLGEHRVTIEEHELNKLEI